jgi:hypothetical protein
MASGEQQKRKVKEAISTMTGFLVLGPMNL